MTAAVCALLAACSSTGNLHPAESTGAPASPAAAQAGSTIQAETESQRASRLLSELSKQSVYFDFDDFSLKPQYQDNVKHNADFMKQSAKDVVTLEGNADERGSKEYNLALGQKRAEAVRKTLVLLGIGDTRIEAISYGAEKPRASCHEEKCWGEDRRVDFAHKSK